MAGDLRLVLAVKQRPGKAQRRVGDGHLDEQVLAQPAHPCRLEPVREESDLATVNAERIGFLAAAVLPRERELRARNGRLVGHSAMP